PHALHFHKMIKVGDASHKDVSENSFQNKINNDAKINTMLPRNIRIKQTTRKHWETPDAREYKHKNTVTQEGWAETYESHPKISGKFPPTTSNYTSLERYSILGPATDEASWQEHGNMEIRDNQETLMKQEKRNNFIYHTCHDDIKELTVDFLSMSRLGERTRSCCEDIQVKSRPIKALVLKLQTYQMIVRTFENRNQASYVSDAHGHYQILQQVFRTPLEAVVLFQNDYDLRKLRNKAQVCHPLPLPNDSGPDPQDPWSPFSLARKATETDIDEEDRKD
ncbi:LOW QUALITY PROTEIN: hypothetical protein U0070_005507, partial [Myodes glareolus]